MFTTSEISQKVLGGGATLLTHTILLKSDNRPTNIKHHRVTELDGQGSKRAFTAAYRYKN